LKDYESAVLLFAKHAHVAFTNNRAERDLRMSKVKQRVSGCFRKREYAEAYCRISSYLQTMANRGYNPLVAIQMALSGQLYAETGESLPFIRILDSSGCRSGPWHLAPRPVAHLLPSDRHAWCWN